MQKRLFREIFGDVTYFAMGMNEYLYQEPRKIVYENTEFEFYPDFFEGEINTWFSLDRFQRICSSNNLKLESDNTDYTTNIGNTSVSLCIDDRPRIKHTFRTLIITSGNVFVYFFYSRWGKSESDIKIRIIMHLIDKVVKSEYDYPKLSESVQEFIRLLQNFS